jgi:hypothetical protein
MKMYVETVVRAVGKTITLRTVLGQQTIDLAGSAGDDVVDLVLLLCYSNMPQKIKSISKDSRQNS